MSDSVILWTVVRQAPLSVGFSRQEYCSTLPVPPPEDLSDPGIEPTSLASPASSGGFFTTSATWEAPTLRFEPPGKPPEVTCAHPSFRGPQTSPGLWQKHSGYPDQCDGERLKDGRKTLSRPSCGHRISPANAGRVLEAANDAWSWRLWALSVPRAP